MKRLVVVLAGWLVWGAVFAEEFPTPEQRQAINDQLQARRSAIDSEYKQALKDCYQKFDVNRCRTEARERRIAADQALRPEEQAYKAMERRINVAESRQRLEEKNSEAQEKEAQAQRAQALQERKQRATEAEQKQIEHELKGTHRGEYDERMREAQEHRADLEKRLRDRNKTPAAPLPVPGSSR